MARTRGPKFSIPNFSVQQLVVACAETMDWSLKAFGIPDLWAKTTGKGVRVAVLDTGCALLHPDLKNQIEDAADFTGSKVGPGDTNGHGTHCCGVVAASRNEVGTVGVAPEVRLLVGKVLNDSGVGSAETIIKGINWATDHGADIISMSFGSSSSDPGIKKAIEYANSKNVLLIAAAGNEGPGPRTVGYPARYPQVLSVAAVDPNKKVAPFSSRGPEVDIAAPGVDILSTYPPKNYAKLSGTSMATPFVSAVIALLLAYDKKRGVKRIKNSVDLIKYVKDTALDAGDFGFDNDYGWGLINPKGLILGQSASSYDKLKRIKKENVNFVELEEKDFASKSKDKFKKIFGGASKVIFEFEEDRKEKSGKHAK